MKRILLHALATLVCFTVTTVAMGQNTQDRQITVTHSDAVEGQAVELKISSPTGAQIDRAVIRYRNFGISEFRFIEAQPQGNDFVGVIPKNFVIAPSIDFYVVAILRDNSQVTFPFLTPVETPATITVRPLPEDPNLVVISPAPQETIRPEDVVISFSYYTISDKVSREKSQLIVDGKDVTPKAIFSENLLTFIPDEPPKNGPLRAEFIAKDSRGIELGRASTFFTVAAATSAKLIEGKREAKFTYTTQNWVELRNESIADSGIFYARANLSAEGIYNDWLRFGTNIYVTNEEEEFAQPSNRFLFRANAQIFEAQVGDIFPDYNFYLSNGVRVRGYDLQLKLAGMRFAITQGDAAREFSAAFGDTRVVPLNTDTTDATITDLDIEGYTLVDSNATTKTYKQITRPGAFRRNYFTAVGGFNSKVFRLELQYLKVKDDIAENAFNDRGIAPQENAGFGASFKISFVPNVFDIYADGALSLFNSDITGGSLTPEQIEDLSGGSITAQDVNDLPFDYKSLITVNSNLAFPTPVANATAFRAGTNLTNNFSSFSNYFKLEYVRQGRNFRSLGLAFYQPDLAGIRVTERIRLLQSRLLISLGFERLSDNLDDQRNIETQLNQIFDATTSRNLFSIGVSVFPGVKLPSVRIEYRNQSNKNDLPATYRDSLRYNNQNDVRTLSGLGSQIDNATNTFQFDVQQTFSLSNQKTLQMGLNTVFTSRTENRNLAPLNTTYTLDSATFIPINDIFYDASNVRTLTSQNFSSRSIGLSATLNFPNSLRFNFGFSNQSSEFSTGVRLDTAINRITRSEITSTQTFNSLDAGIGYSFFNGKLRPNARVSLTFGDFSRTLIGGSAIYDINPAQSVTADLNFFLVGEKTVNGVKVASATDVVASIRYQFLLGN